MSSEPAHTQSSPPRFRPVATSEPELLETANQRDWYHTLELEPGVVGVLHAGDRAVWRIHETLCKVFQITESS